jgi:hypothetical protein
MKSTYEPPSFSRLVPVSPPDIIHHYTDQRGLLGIIQNRELWATKIQYMNDASEFSMIFNMVDARLWTEERNEIPDAQMMEMIARRLEGSGSPILPSRTTMLRNFATSGKNVNLCVVCFCTNGDLLSQWRGYSGNGYGYSIAFYTHRLKEFASKSGFALRPCIYDKTIQKRIVEEICDYYLNNIKQSSWENAQTLLEECASTVISYGAFFKDPSFSEEDEWRLVSEPIDDHDLCFRAGKSMIIPYSKKINFHGSFVDTPIADVVVGPCPHMDLAVQAVTNLLQSQKKEKLAAMGRTVRPSIIPYRDW